MFNSSGKRVAREESGEENRQTSQIIVSDGMVTILAVCVVDVDFLRQTRVGIAFIKPAGEARYYFVLKARPDVGVNYDALL